LLLIGLRLIGLRASRPAIPRPSGDDLQCLRSMSAECSRGVRMSWAADTARADVW